MDTASVEDLRMITFVRHVHFDAERMYIKHVHFAVEKMHVGSLGLSNFHLSHSPLLMLSALPYSIAPRANLLSLAANCYFLCFIISLWFICLEIKIFG